MKYGKPEITKMQRAVEAIQSDLVKQIHRVLDSPNDLALSPAYGADE